MCAIWYSVRVSPTSHRDAIKSVVAMWSISVVDAVAESTWNDATTSPVGRRRDVVVTWIGP
jgi:hypothetical protein